MNVNARKPLRFGNHNERFGTFASDEVIHDISAHVRSNRIQLEERVIISQCQSPLNKECMMYSRIPFLLAG